MDEIIYASAAKLAEAIREKKISSQEVVSANLARIEAINPKLNAIVQIAGENALAEAGRADAALARGDDWGPLHGVPMTIKDSVDTAGLVSSWGTPGRAKHVPDQDATIVTRLRQAGAILMGKSNTPELTLAYETDNAIYGRSNNPYNLDRTPGGSSGGAAAAIAAGGTPFDIGSDTGGSIRLPAHFCGIVGIKPTSGRVPRTGHAIPAGGLLDAATQLGPMARSVEDLALILPLISGPDGRDPSIVPAPLGKPGDVDLKSLRGAFFTDNGILPAIDEIAAVTQSASEALSAAGMRFEEARPAGIEETLEIYNDLYRGWDGGAWVRLLLQRAGTATEESSLDRFLEARSGTPEMLVNLLDRWDRFKVRMLSFLERYDVILAPVNANVALYHGQFREKYASFSYTQSFNLTGWPAAVVRAGTSQEGLPIGVQVIAGPWREDVALAVAGKLEEIFGGWEPPEGSFP